MQTAGLWSVLDVAGMGMSSECFVSEALLSSWPESSPLSFSSSLAALRVLFCAWSPEKCKMGPPEAFPNPPRRDGGMCVQRGRDTRLKSQSR